MRAAFEDKDVDTIIVLSDGEPSVGEVIGLDDVPAALDRVRRADGPPRIIVRPDAGGARG